MATFFAASILVDGAVNIWGSIRHREKDGWWIMLLIGALGVLVGGYALLNPLVSMTAFVFLVAFQAVLLGVFTIMLGYKVRAATEKRMDPLRHWRAVGPVRHPRVRESRGRAAFR